MMKTTLILLWLSSITLFQGTDTMGSRRRRALGVSSTPPQQNIDECASDPCGSNGECVDAVDSFTCNCDPGYGGINCQPLITVQCTSDSMTVIVDGSIVSGDAASVHFLDPTCVGIEAEEGAAVSLTTRYDQCGTELSEDEPGTITFSNIVTYDKPAPQDGSVITREYHMQASVKCCLDKEQILTGSFKPQLGKVSFTEKSTGNFTLILERFDYYGLGIKPVVWLGERLYFHALLLQYTPNVGLYIERCVASTSLTPGEGIEHKLITDGCPDLESDKTVSIVSLNLDPADEEFYFDAFTFVGDFSEVYIHCTVKVCERGRALKMRDPANCSPAAKRKRRSPDGSSTHTISSGPITVRRRSGNDLEASFVSSYNSVGMLLLGVVVVLVALATMRGVVKLTNTPTSLRQYERLSTKSKDEI